MIEISTPFRLTYRRALGICSYTFEQIPNLVRHNTFEFYGRAFAWDVKALNIGTPKMLQIAREIAASGYPGWVAQHLHKRSRENLIMGENKGYQTFLSTSAHF